MDIKKFVSPLLKWWWLLVISTLIGAGASFLATRNQPEMYQARTTLMIGRTIDDPNPTSGEFVLGSQLATAYADIANRDLVRSATRNALGLAQLPEYQAQALLNTQIIEILVKDANPEIAQKVANELGAQLIQLSPTTVQAEEQDRREFLNAQLNNLEVQISETETQIEQLQADLGNLTSAKEITDTKTQISAFESKLTALQSNYATLLSNTSQGATNTLNVIEPATLPGAPLGSTKIITILLAAFVGFVLAASAAYLLEFLDGSLKSPEEIERLFQTPVLGRIVNAPESKNGNEFSVAEHPRHPIAEAFRTLRTNLEFSDVDKKVKTILVTSAGIGDGKTWIAANLAIAMAQEDKKVILVDADLRRPSVHNFFKLSNEVGLGDVFLGHQRVGDILKYNNGDKVAIITAGEELPDPTELLSSKKMDQLLAKLSEVVDLIIIDGPPIFVADAAILASKADATLVVVRPGHTQKNAAEALVEQIHIAGGNLVGVAINRIHAREIRQYSGYSNSHYKAYYGDASKKKSNPPANHNGLNNQKPTNSKTA